MGWAIPTLLRDKTAASLGAAPLFVVGLFFGIPATTAWAACDQTGSTVSCTGTTVEYDAGSQSGITITVQSGATIKGYDPNKAFKLTNPSGVSGDTIVNNGTIDGLIAILSAGSGIDRFTNNGILEITDPNTALDTLSMAGTRFIQTASGWFMARVDANGFNDSILAYNATLAGHFVAVIQPGLYTTPMTYTGVVSTFNGITGSFDSVTSSSPFFTAVLTPSGGNNLDLTITRVAFNGVPGETPNQRTIGNVLENIYNAGTPTGNAETFFSNLFAATSITALDQLSGVATTAAQDASFSAGSMFSNAMMQQGLSWLNAADGGSSADGGALGYAAATGNKSATKPGYDAFAAMGRINTADRWRSWGAGFGGGRTTDGQTANGTANQSTNAFGGAFGFDHQVSADFLVGMAVGGSQSHFSVDSLSSSGHADAAHIGLYTVHTFGAAYLAATLNYARVDTTSERTLTGIGTTEYAKGRFASNQLGGRLELGWKHAMPGYTVTPFMAIEPAALWQQAYTETSTTANGTPGVFGLSYQANTVTTLPTFLGAQFDTRYQLDNGQSLTPYLRASWMHEFEPDRGIAATFITLPTASLSVDGTPAVSDAARIEAGGTLTFNRQSALFANLNSEVSGRSRSLAGMAGARVTW